VLLWGNKINLEEEKSMKKNLTFVVLALLIICIITGCGTTGGAAVSSGSSATALRQSKLLMVLPDWIKTPDSMTADRQGNLVLSCPNFADENTPGFIVKISKDLKVTKWFDVPVNPATGVARPMGLDFEDDKTLWVVDNQGWLGGRFENHGRLLKLTVDEAGTVSKVTVVAQNFEHPNGVKIRDGYAYVTASCMSPVTRPDGLLTSGLYRFALNEENVTLKNDLTDKNLIASFATYNPRVQYGLDGLVFDKAGNLYVGNFGDGELIRITFNADKSIKGINTYAKNSGQLETTDGMCIDDKGNIYVADFSPNAVAMVTTDGNVYRIAKSSDNNGLKGELDQPGEPFIWNGKLILSCFDMVTDEGKVNTAHQAPATLAYLDLYE
jgi:sugar lactone lactonase YvrE